MPKVQFRCFHCKKAFMEWPSQVHSDQPSCSWECRNLGAMVKDLTGARFGRLVALERVRDKRKRTTYYHCRCDCGHESRVTHSNLQSGSAQSCGCLQREVLSQRSRKDPRLVVSRAVYNYYVRNARKRGLAWALGFEEFCDLIRHPCFFCGTQGGTTTTTANNSQFQHNGVDRLDPYGGYNKDNVVTCCKICNCAKNSLSTGDFLQWVTRIYAFTQSKKGGVQT